MPTEAERDGGDARGFVLAVTGVLAAGATFLITPGSGAGPATLAVIAWLAVLAAASWAALVHDGASTGRHIGAALFAAASGAGFVATIESGWALIIPGTVVAGALGRRRSLARFVAMAAWLVAIGYIVLDVAPQ